MINLILLGLIIIPATIAADPGPVANADPYAPQAPPPPYNYYDYQSQQRQQQGAPSSTNSGKRSQYSNMQPDQQYPSSSLAVTYGNAANRKTAANQCKLHINCPSKLLSKQKSE